MPLTSFLVVRERSHGTGSCARMRRAKCHNQHEKLCKVQQKSEISPAVAPVGRASLALPPPRADSYLPRRWRDLRQTQAALASPEANNDTNAWLICSLERGNYPPVLRIVAFSLNDDQISVSEAPSSQRAHGLKCQTGFPWPDQAEADRLDGQWQSILRKQRSTPHPPSTIMSSLVTTSMPWLKPHDNSDIFGHQKRPMYVPKRGKTRGGFDWPLSTPSTTGNVQRPFKKSRAAWTMATPWHELSAASWEHEREHLGKLILALFATVLFAFQVRSHHKQGGPVERTPHARQVPSHERIGEFLKMCFPTKHV